MKKLFFIMAMSVCAFMASSTNYFRYSRGVKYDQCYREV